MSAPTPTPGDTRPDGPADERTPAQVDALIKQARDKAYGWKAARLKLESRGDEWAAAMATAREQGAPPGALRELIEEAAFRARVPVDAVPNDVWRAAGIETENG
ncbi:hypothetical protein [Bounagaea algeriensis]